MANERDDKLQDEGEYHFSDDQINYEMEDVPATEEAKPLPTESVLAKAGNYRRYIIGGVVFIVLIYMVYRMLVPAPTPPPTEIAQTAPPSAAKSAISTQPIAAVPSQAKPVSTVTPSQPVQAAMQMPTEAAPHQAAAPVAPSSPPIIVQAQQAAPTPTASAPSDIKTVIDKLSVLEEQNAKLTNVLDSNSQKLSSYEAQNTALQAKVLELTTRIAAIESGLNQLSQMQGDKTVQIAPASGNGTAATPPPPVKPSEPRINYTVQAIIPGRAWLKSDGGETVTVAEGDVLKNFGRVIKLDPYDGVVEVDTGSRVVTLTYGGGSS